MGLRRPLLHGRDRRGSRRPATGRGVVLAVLLLMTSWSLLGAEEPHRPARLRIAFASSMFTGVNESDAKAAVKVWATTVAKERGIEVDPVPQIFGDGDDLAGALQRNEVDVAAVTTVQYFDLAPEVEWGELYATIIGGTLTENYIVLVRRDGNITDLADLRGRSLVYLATSRTCLALPWLDTLLSANGLDTSQACMGTVTARIKLAQVVLPVFFGQADACLVTLKGFRTMEELNPQIGRELKILETSPDIVPAVFAFRQGYDSPAREDVLTGMRELHLTPAGRQVLTVFQSEQVVALADSRLDTARFILANRMNEGSKPDAQPGGETVGSSTKSRRGGL